MKLKTSKNLLKNLNIAKKLTLGFLAVTALGIAIGAVAIVSLITITNNQQSSYNNDTLGIVYATDAQSSLLTLRTLARDLYIYYDGQKEDYCNKISAEITTLEACLTKYETTIQNSKNQQQYDNLITAYQTYKNTLNDLMNIAKSKQSEDVYLETLRNQNSSAGDTQSKFQALVDYNVNAAKEQAQTDLHSSEISIYIMVGAIILSIAISLALGLTIARSISYPIKKFAKASGLLAVGDIDMNGVLVEKDYNLRYRKDEIGSLALGFHDLISSIVEQSNKAKQIADGDLTTEITIRSPKDVLGNALAELVDKFNSLAVSIVASADQVDSGAKLVSESSTSISQGATEQASSIEELSSSIEEITSQTTLNAQNAQKTNDLAKIIQKDADAGNAQMSNMLNAMEEINEASDNIGKVIKVIEDIAFQTNILALNAAVEAARAGQHGKGFAVVAEEVRNLAAQSSRAAKETTELIENSVKKVVTGTQIASETAGALSKIIGGISQASELVASITGACHEQAAALSQINRGIVEISQVVQSNAASSEECAAASEELSTQADTLKEHVRVFKTNSDSHIPQEEISLSKRQKIELDGLKTPESNKVQKKPALSSKEYGKY